MIYSALDLSKYIVSKCVRENCPVSNLQLQKILYYTTELHSAMRLKHGNLGQWFQMCTISFADLAQCPLQMILKMYLSR